jgi:putative phosphoesterase
MFMPVPYPDFLPPDIDAGQIAACFGILSDTHMPQRCAALPPTLGTVFAGVDLIMHAGDLGELWVLDELSRIAPVIAVHGNDETADAQRELPYQQVITAHGQRVVLCHSHHPDRAAEMALRQDDAWQPKLERRLELGRRAGASVVVFGHTHIPMTYRQDGLLLLNPGALASGSALARQLHKTVALLYLFRHRPPVAVHVDLSAPHQIFASPIDWNAGFRAALSQYSASLIAPELAAGWPRFEALIRAWMADLARADTFENACATMLRIAQRCWADEQPYITRLDLLQMLDELDTDRRIAPEDSAALRATLT